MSPAVLVGGVVLSHMFGGQQSPTGNIQRASLVVIGTVEKVTPRPDAVNELRLNIHATPCAPTTVKPPKTLVIVEMGDHTAGYVVGERLVFPLHPARESPHRPEHVRPEMWTVDQPSPEVIHVAVDEQRALAPLITRLCRARSAEEQLDTRLAILRSPFTRLAGGAARDLMTGPEPGMPSRTGVKDLLDVLFDVKRPVGIRMAAVHVATRSGDAALEQAAAERLRSDEPPELIMAIARGLSKRGELLEPRIFDALAVPGPGRVAVMRVASARKLVGAREALQKIAGSSTGEARAACVALHELGDDSVAACTAFR